MSGREFLELVGLHSMGFIRQHIRAGFIKKNKTSKRLRYKVLKFDSQADVSLHIITL